MGWLLNKANQWATRTQLAELDAFVGMLRSMDSAELGHVVAIATHWRHGLEDMGHNLMDPIIYAEQNPGFAAFLSASVANAQKADRRQDAAALLVWLHTTRAGRRLELRGLGREMWGELARGFPFVEDGAAGMHDLAGVTLRILDARQFPEGFTPRPL